MKISYEWLNKEYFDGKLPGVSAVEQALTFHAWEIEETVGKGDDTMLDVKVLPDRSSWALSHRGIAKDLAAVLGIPMAEDPLSRRPALTPTTDTVTLDIQTPGCTRYVAAKITGITVGPSPLWLKTRLETIGQRSINNVVDITNYAMFSLGQPLHAFDAQKLKGGAIRVRQAREKESLISLTGESYTLSALDMVIADGVSDEAIGIAGVKGGKVAEVDQNTTDIILESAHFSRVSVRKTAQRLKLRTDASTRYENGVVPDMTVYGIAYAVALLKEYASGNLVGFTDSGKDAEGHLLVSAPLSRLNSVLGLSMSKEAVESVIVRFGYPHTWEGDVLSVTPPFERTDLSIPEDLIEEIGRVYGYEHVASVTPSPTPLFEINPTFYYTNRIRGALLRTGFSEILTSSFRNQDLVKLQNALASDKGYLRSALSENVREALAKNAPNADLFGLRQVALFEVGTVFGHDGEHLSLAVGVSSPSGYKPNIDEPFLKEGMRATEDALGVALSWTEKDGVAEAVLSFETLPKPSAYEPVPQSLGVTYRPFSVYPFSSRDIALWAPGGADVSRIEEDIRSAAGPLLIRLDLFDRFEKDGKVSFAFRLVFQSHEKTLTEPEVVEVMDRVSRALEKSGFEIR